MKSFLACVFALSVIGCTDPIKPQSRKMSSNPTAEVDFLFEVEGKRGDTIEIYRFHDGDNTVYFTIPPGVTSGYRVLKDDDGEEIIRTDSIGIGKKPLR